MANVHISVEDLREIVSYDQSTGDLRWKINSGVRRVGDLVKNHDKNGYNRLCYLGGYYFAHRVAWALHSGEWPSEMIDHVNGVKSDNRIDNLREATRSQNCVNRAPTSTPRAKSGYFGVVAARAPGSWGAKLVVNRKRLYLGTFKTPEDAARAYDKSAFLHFGEFATLNFPRTALQGGSDV